MITGQNKVGTRAGTVVSLDDEEGGPDVEILLLTIESSRQLEARLLELVVREGDRDVEQARRAAEAGVVALELDEAKAPILLPVALQTFEDVEPADNRLRRDVENGLLPRSHFAGEENPVGRLKA